MKIYGLDMPTFNAWKVLLVAEELGIEYEYVKMDAMAGEHREEAHKKRHPLGKIPVLIDGDRTLFESMAIVRYLMRQHAGALDGDDPHQSDQFAEFMLNHSGRAIGNLYWQEVVVVKAMGGEPDLDTVNQAKQQLTKEMPIFASQLEANPWLGGSSYSVADCVVLAYCLSLGGTSQSLADWPAIENWYQRAMLRSASQRALAHYG